MNLLDEIARFNPEPALMALIQSMQDSLDHQRKTAQQDLETSRLALQQAQLKIQALTLELAHHRRLKFGVKSEAFSAEQKHLFEETWQEDATALEVAVDQLNPTPRKPRVRAGRQPLPDHLPRQVHVHEPTSCQCGQCGNALLKIGEDITEQLDIIPAQFFVHRHIRPKYTCRTCDTVVAEPVPPAIIEGGMAAPGLLTWVMISKYVDHLPLYRLEQMAARSGVPLARSTLAEWVGRMGFALQPLAERLSELLRQRSVLHADETPVAQLDPGAGKTKRAYLWTWRSCDLAVGNCGTDQLSSVPPPIVVFDYQTSRAGKHADSFLGDWHGHLMVDDYAGYKHLFAESGNDVIIELGCWAHARRKFFELHAANQSPIAQTALNYIAALYGIEAQAKEISAEHRQALRQQSQQILKEFFDWLINTRQKVAPNSGTAKAIDYTLKRWQALVRYADTGHFPIDNNPVENCIRPIAVGKKNWLFAGSERAGKRAAAIQTLLGTAKLNGIEPYAWLKDTLEKLPTWPNSRIDELLPLKTQTAI
jgi:transposase